MALIPPYPSREAAGETVIDCHVHLAALPDGNNGCYVARTLLKSLRFRYLSWKHGLNLEDPVSANKKYVEDLLSELRGSRFVGKAVLLAMDGVYDDNGCFQPEKTDFFVSNDYVLQITESYPDKFWPGVSINPRRRDAIEELDRCVKAGAKLVKVLPNSQAFDPGSRQYIPFYRRLAYHKIPLLSHVGYEFSIRASDQSAGHPDRLRVPLDEGVTVIAAHGCSSGLIVDAQYSRTFSRLVRAYRNFYADLSALTLPNRFGTLLRLQRHPELQDRLLFGTDYPLPVLHWPCWGRVPMSTLRAIVRITNRFDRQFLIVRSLGIAFRPFHQLYRS